MGYLRLEFVSLLMPHLKPRNFWLATHQNKNEIILKHNSDEAPEISYNGSPNL